MGFLSNILDNSMSSEARLSAIVKKSRMLYSGNDNNEYLEFLEKLSTNANTTVIRPFSFCVEVLEMMMANTDNYNTSNYYQTVKKLEKLYLDIFIYDENTPNLRELQLVFLELLEEDGVLARSLFRLSLFMTFRDKNNYMYFMNSFMQSENAHMVMPELDKHGVVARQYFIDDMDYCFHMISVAEKLILALGPEREGILSEEVKKLERMNGIYNVDAVDIARAESQLNEARSILRQSTDVIAIADEKTRQLRMLEEELAKSLSETMKREEELLKAKAAAAREGMKADYEAFVEQQQNHVIFERQEFVEKLFEESRAELDKLRATANSIAATATKDLAKAQRDAIEVLEKTSHMVHEDASVREILQKTDADKKLKEKIERLQFLNESNIKAMEMLLAQQQAPKAEEKTVVVQEKKAEKVVKVVAKDDDERPAPVASSLNDDITFSKRFEELMELKKLNMQMGVHYHEKFDDVLIAVMENANPYLIGPSGCGKTFMVKQIAELLGVDFIDIGYINEEYDILGFQTADGGYSKPNFYRCYKYGKIAFCDELDNGNSRATVKLNSFLSNNTDGSYNFPNGEHVNRHKNFRIIGAGNTSGAGADENYSTREKIEESVQQRFTPIYVDYDNAVEKKILKDYSDWYLFCILFREATSAFERESGIVAPGILTTRDTVKIKRYMDNKSFTPEKIIKYEFVQTKDIEYLMYISKYMQDHIKNYNSAAHLIKLFDSQVREININGRR